MVEEQHTDVDGSCLALGDIHTVVITGLHDKGDGLTGCGREVMKWGRVPQDTS